ncbi:MAG: phospholipase D-like domain-containing protein [Blastomonas sp.]
MKTELLDADSVRKRLRKLIRKHDKISLAVAWGYNGKVADCLFQHCDKFETVMFGVSFCQTDPALVDRLVGLRNAYIAESSNGTFHPKLYYFQTGDFAEAIVGSSNFTGGGLGKNWEACLHIRGAADAPAFEQIRSTIDGYRELRKPVSTAMAKSYRLQFDTAKKHKRPKNPILPSDKSGWRQLTSPLVEMDWKTYVSLVQGSRFHELDRRLGLLREAQKMIASAASSADLSPNEWKAIAGVIGEAQKREANLEGHDWKWFGSMSGMGDFANRVKDQDAWLARAMDSIPRHGDISQDQFDTFCEQFLRAFENSHRTGGVPTATRLLAMKRPDTFVCISKPNLAGISTALSFAKTTLNLENYWGRVVEPIRASIWYNAKRPTGESGQIWDGRAAMLDAIYYDPA